MDGELVTVSREFSSLKANLIRSRLEVDGIRVFLSGETLASVVGSPSTMGNEISVQVQSFDATRARRILREIEEAPRNDDEKWAEIKPKFAVQAVRGLLIGGAIWSATMLTFGATGYAAVGVLAGVSILVVIVGIGFKNSFKTKR
jgi:hypothetical protein